MLTNYLETLRDKNKMIPSGEGKELIERLGKSAYLRQLWGLVLANIIAISCLGGVLVLMSKDPAYLILSVGITFCAAAVVAVSGYISWTLAKLNREVCAILEGYNSLDQGLMLTDVRGLIQFYNEKISNSFGQLNDVPLDVFTERYIHLDSIKDFIRLRKAAHEGQEAEGTIQIGQSGQPYELWYVKAIPLVHGQGSVFWVFDNHFPQGREMQASLDAAQPFTSFRSVFESAPMGVVLLDKECRIRAFNRFFQEELFKAPLEVEKSFPELLHEKCRDQVLEFLEKIMEGEKVPLPLEIQFKHNQSAQISAFASRIENRSAQHPEQPKSSGVILHFFDNSEQKRLHVQLVQSQKMQAMGQLAGGIAHDFNNLLTAMIGFCDLLLLRHSPGDQSFTDIMQIKQNANRAANLVRQLLAFSKQQTLQPQMLNISEILSEVSVLLQRLVGVNIELEIIHGRDIGLIKVDKGQLEQVIINLVVNARDAMNEKGTITIKTYNKNYTEEVHINHDLIPPGSYVVIEVEDTGCGISKENLSRIFDPFFSTKELGRGTGLGLSTVYGIVKQTGGYIMVDSEVEKGARFKVIFPYHDVAKVSAEMDRSKKKQDAGDLTGSGTILFVEDEDAVRLFGARALRDKGYRVIEARDGEEAMAYIRAVVDNTAEKIDLMVTDVVMPVMDGVQLVREAHAIMPELSIIYISGYAEDSFRQKIGQEESIHFLPKPFSLKELARKVKDVMNEQDRPELVHEVVKNMSS